MKNVRQIGPTIVGPQGARMDNLLGILLAIFISPLAVLLKRGVGKSFFLNIILWLFFVIPGIVHALLVIMDDD